MEIKRREFLERVFGVPLALGPLALGMSASCAREQARHEQIPGVLLGQNASAGHLLRTDLRERLSHISQLPPIRSEVVIAGGGPAGLSAAYALARADLRDFVLLELEPVLGGTARGDASHVSAYPWGAHYLPVPQPHNVALTQLLREMGVVSGIDHDGELVVAEPYLVRAPEERLFFKGYWYPGLYLEAGASASDLEERRRFERLIASWVRFRDSQGRRAFTIPTRLASDAPELRALDQLSAREFLRREGFRSSRLLWQLDYACRDDYGLRLEQTSAWALLFYFAARVERAGEEPSDLITWPEGNFALVRQLARAAQDRTRTNMLVLDVHEQDEHVELSTWDLTRDVGVRYQAQRAVIATPRFITERIVRSERERAASVPSAARASYAPWLVANLHLHTRPETRGAALAWDNVLHDSPSLGYVCATHQRGSDFGPTVLTYYLPLSDADEKQARQKLFDGDLSAWRAAVLHDLARAHPELPSLLSRLDVFRWGHAMVRPVVCSIFQPARLRAQVARGRLHFAHSDLSGVSLFEEAFDHGVRAAAEALSALGRERAL